MVLRVGWQSGKVSQYAEQIRLLAVRKERQRQWAEERLKRPRGNTGHVFREVPAQWGRASCPRFGAPVVAPAAHW